LTPPIEKLIGTISAAPLEVLQGLEVALAYDIQNPGNRDVKDVRLEVLVVDPNSAEVRQTHADTVDILKNSNAAGSFAASTTLLAPGTYSVDLTVSNDETPALLVNSAAFEVLPSVEVSRVIGSPVNLLVWINTGCGPPDGCIRMDLLENILTEAVDDYAVFFDKKDVEVELRNPYYSDILILGDQAPLTDHFVAELQEKIYSGTGLVTALWLKNGFEEEMFGINYIGALPGSAFEIDLAPDLVSTPGYLPAVGVAARVEAAASATVRGWVVDEVNEYPAVVFNENGLGRTAYLGFDLGAALNDATFDQVKELIAATIDHVHRETDSTAFYPYQLVAVEMAVQSLALGVDLEISETYSTELSLFDATLGDWISDNPWTFGFPLEPEEKALIRYFFLTPDSPGTYFTEATQDCRVNDVSMPLEADTFTTEITVDDGIADLLDGIIAELSLLSVSGQDRAKVENAIRYIETVQQREVIDDADVEANIQDILKAVEGLVKVESADISDIRLMLDELLRCEQGLYYFF
jgi:hypothetical protein